MKKIHRPITNQVNASSVLVQPSDATEDLAIGEYVNTVAESQVTTEIKLDYCIQKRVDAESAISGAINDMEKIGYTNFQVIPGLAGRYTIIALLK